MPNKLPEAEYRDGLLEFENREDAKKAVERLNSMDPSAPGYTEIIGNYFNDAIKNAFEALGLEELEEVIPEYGNSYRQIENTVVPNDNKITEEDRQAMKLYSQSTSEEELEKFWTEARQGVQE